MWRPEVIQPNLAKNKLTAGKDNQVARGQTEPPKQGIFLKEWIVRLYEEHVRTPTRWEKYWDICTKG